MSQNNAGSRESARHNYSSFGNQELASKINLEPYMGRWVAVAGDRVAGVGETALSAEHMGRRNRVRERLAIYFVEPLDGAPFPFSDLFESIRPVLLGLDVPVYLVGGAVRDGLIGQTSHDLDFVVPHDGIQIAYSVANKLGCPAFVLDEERDAARVVFADPATTLDFTSFRGPDINADLRGRDFTINAMALPVAAQSKDSLIDPLDGRSDLREQTIRLCYPEAIHDDPVRGLRAIRMLIETGFQPKKATVSAVIDAAPRLTNVSVERIRDELLKLFATHQPGTALEYLYTWQFLPTIIPELKLLPGYVEAESDQGPVLRRTEKILENLVALQRMILDYENESPTLPDSETNRLNQVRVQLLPYRTGLAAHFNRQLAGAIDGWLVMRLAALFHHLFDNSTIRSDPIDAGGLPGDNSDPVQLADKVLKRYRFSNQVSQHIKQTIRGYGLPTRLSNTEFVDRRSAYRYFRVAPDAGLDLCLLTIAGYIVSPDDRDEWVRWTQLLQVTTQLMEHYFNHYQTTIRPVPLVDGNDLIKHLSLVPGPEIGRLLQLIEEAQASGEVTTPEQALELARRLVSVN